MPSTIKDVSIAAGVSIATVSHVINQTRYVTDDVKAKVYAAMEKLDYNPNSIARSLRSQQTKTIGVMVPSIRSLFYSRVTDGIEETMRENGYHIILANSHDDRDREMDALRTFKSLRIDGLMMCPSVGEHTYLKNMLPASTPVVFIDRYPLDYEGDHVVIDLSGSTYDVINLLIKKGHQKIGMITGYKGLSSTKARFEGYQAAYQDNGLPYDEELIQSGAYTSDAGYENTKKIIENTDATALFYADDPMVIGSLLYLHEKKIRIPDQISIVSCNDYEWTRISNPPLTIVKKPSYQLGIKAAELMLDKIEKRVEKDKIHKFCLSTTIVMRSSVKDLI